MEQRELAIRVEKLERENRIFKLTATAAGVGLLGALLASATGQEGASASELIETRRIRLVDDSGRVGVEIDASSLTLTGAEAGDERFRSRLGPAGLEVLLGPEAQPRAVLEVNTREIDLIDYARERRAVIQPASFGLQRGIHGPSEHPISWVRMRASGLELQDEEGRVRTRVGVPLGSGERSATEEEAGAGGLVFYDGEGKVVWRAP